MWPLLLKWWHSCWCQMGWFFNYSYSSAEIIITLEFTQNCVKYEKHCLNESLLDGNTLLIKELARLVLAYNHFISGSTPWGCHGYRSTQAGTLIFLQFSTVQFQLVCAHDSHRFLFLGDRSGTWYGLLLHPLHLKVWCNVCNDSSLM